MNTASKTVRGRYFRLEHDEPIVPNQGEELGAALEKAALEKEKWHREGPGSVEYWASTTAQLFYLAADAFDAGASASIGHNRSARYEEKARELRHKASTLYEEGRAAQAARDNEAFQKAFAAGFNGEDGSPFSFDRREAWLIGKHFASQSLPAPAFIRSVYDYAKERGGGHWMETDGKRFTVEYPNGKIADAVLTELVD